MCMSCFSLLYLPPLSLCLSPKTSILSSFSAFLMPPSLSARVWVCYRVLEKTAKLCPRVPELSKGWGLLMPTKPERNVNSPRLCLVHLGWGVVRKGALQLKTQFPPASGHADLSKVHSWGPREGKSCPQARSIYSHESQAKRDS